MDQNLSFITAIALVVSSPEPLQGKGKELWAKVRMKTRGPSGGECFFDLYARGSKATEMNLTCKRGNIMLIKACLANKNVGKGLGRTSKLYLLMTDSEIIKKPYREPTGEEEPMDLISLLDPSELLGGDYAEAWGKDKKIEL